DVERAARLLSHRRAHRAVAGGAGADWGAVRGNSPFASHGGGFHRAGFGAVLDCRGGVAGGGGEGGKGDWVIGPSGEASCRSWSPSVHSRPRTVVAENRNHCLVPFFGLRDRIPRNCPCKNGSF